MARKAVQIIARGTSRWLVRVYLGCDPQTRTRKYNNPTMSMTADHVEYSRYYKLHSYGCFNGIKYRYQHFAHLDGP
jgi:hypothetical protein